MKKPWGNIKWATTAFCLLIWGRAIAAGPFYDPLAKPTGATPEIADLMVDDARRHRDIPLRVYLPSARLPAPVILFSHGLGGSRDGSAYLGNHWAARGYVAVLLQHRGSDIAVWQSKPLDQRMEAMKQAASLENFTLRVDDVSAVLDQLGRWDVADKHILAGRLDLLHVGMAGHSFGAVTTQAVGGQSYLNGHLSFADPRIKAAMALSPSSPRLEADLRQAFVDVKIPWLLMTGTRDIAFIGDADVKSRLTVFPALPAGGKYELVLYRAEHSTFTDRAMPGDREIRNPNHHRVILALSTAFWDAWLRGDAAARIWLDGDGPYSVLEKDDRWRLK